MCLSATVVIYLILITKTKADIEDHDATLNIVDSPVSVNFNEIFSSHLSMLSDDKGLAQAKDISMLSDDKSLTQAKDTTDKDFHLDSSQFVEFRFPKIETSTIVITTTTTPPPRYVIGAAYLKNNNQTEETTTSTTTTTTTTTVSTEVPETTTPIPLKVPLKKKDDQQRGVLDLLFPSYRVKAFKNVFDSLRMVLSHTFRRR